jgi:hypothetical protein
MGYPTKVQLIRRQASEQWYINFPAALAHAMEFTRGETVEWIIEDRSQLLLRQPPPSRKKKRSDSSSTSAGSGKTPRRSAASSASTSERKPSP